MSLLNVSTLDYTIRSIWSPELKPIQKHVQAITILEGKNIHSQKHTHTRAHTYV